MRFGNIIIHYNRKELKRFRSDTLEKPSILKLIYLMSGTNFIFASVQQ